MKLKNIEMSNYLIALNNVSEKVTGMLAYAVARNIRKISNEVAEYEQLKNDAIVKYGVLGEDGISRIQIGTEEYEKCMDELSQYSSIEHDVDIFTVNSSALQDSSLNAKDIMSIDFMLEE